MNPERREADLFEIDRFDQPETAPTEDPRYQEWLQDLESGKLFAYAERSSASTALMQRGTGWMKQLDSRTAELLQLCGRMAISRRSLLDVSLAIARGVNPHSARGEWEASIFRAAGRALSQVYDDVERRSGPESYRLSDCQRPYTLAERFLVLEALYTMCEGRIQALGWCAQLFLEQQLAGPDPCLRRDLANIAPRLRLEARS